MGPNEKQKIEIEKLHWTPLPPLDQAVTADYSDFLGTALSSNNSSWSMVIEEMFGGQH
jgi:hypothetical protein